MVGEDSSDVDDADLQDSDMELDDEFNHKEIQMNAGYLLNTFFLGCSIGSMFPVKQCLEKSSS